MSQLLELVCYIVIFVVGYYAGQIVAAYRMTKMIVNEARKHGIDIESLAEDEEPEKTEKVPQLFIERIDNVLYLYERETKNFVCQASSIEELAKLAKEYKNIRYAAVLDLQMKEVFAFIDGKAEIQV